MKNAWSVMNNPNKTNNSKNNGKCYTDVKKINVNIENNNITSYSK